MLKHEYFLTKIGVDTAENEPEAEVRNTNYTFSSLCFEPSVPQRSSCDAGVVDCAAAKGLSELAALQGVRSAYVPVTRDCKLGAFQIFHST